MPKLVSVRSEFDDEPAERVVLQWHERTLIFKLNSRVYGVDAWVYGTLAVHSEFINSMAPPYVITHKPSLIQVARVHNSDEAMAQAEWLWESCPRAWAGELVDKSIFTPEMLEWLKKNQ